MQIMTLHLWYFNPSAKALQPPWSPVFSSESGCIISEGFVCAHNHFNFRKSSRGGMTLNLCHADPAEQSLIIYQRVFSVSHLLHLKKALCTTEDASVCKISVHLLHASHSFGSSLHSFFVNPLNLHQNLNFVHKVPAVIVCLCAFLLPVLSVLTA